MEVRNLEIMLKVEVSLNRSQIYFAESSAGEAVETLDISGLATAKFRSALLLAVARQC